MSRLRLIPMLEFRVGDVIPAEVLVYTDLNDLLLKRVNIIKILMYFFIYKSFLISYMLITLELMIILNLSVKKYKIFMNHAKKNVFLSMKHI